MSKKAFLEAKLVMLIKITAGAANKFGKTSLFYFHKKAMCLWSCAGRKKTHEDSCILIEIQFKPITSRYFPVLDCKSSA